MSRALALIEPDAADGSRIVTVRGEVDVGSTPALRDWLARASDGGRRSIVVDLRGVQFLAVSGLYVLCDEQHRMASHRARMTILCTDPRALQLFTVCRLDTVLHLAPDRAAAPSGPWSEDDEARTERLRAWLQRYSAESA